MPGASNRMISRCGSSALTNGCSSSRVAPIPLHSRSCTAEGAATSGPASHRDPQDPATGHQRARGRTPRRAAGQDAQQARPPAVLGCAGPQRAGGHRHSCRALVGRVAVRARALRRSHCHLCLPLRDAPARSAGPVSTPSARCSRRGSPVAACHGGNTPNCHHSRQALSAGGPFGLSVHDRRPAIAGQRVLGPERQGRSPLSARLPAAKVSERPDDSRSAPAMSMSWASLLTPTGPQLRRGRP